ncbi:MAG: D-alanyl-D-alanine carboxypeptidase/D-alanyl-D-alanine-endopeptidase [Elusimicrobiales bacterium]
MRGFTTCLLVALAQAPVLAQSGPLEAQYRALAQSPAASGAQWAVYAADADTGKVLLDHNAGSRLIPASTLKLFVTAAAVSVLGPDYKFKTDVCASSGVSNGTLDGDIVVVGGGDPSLGSTVIEGARDYRAVINSWADAVKSAGIREISGGVAADVSLFDGLPVPDSWPYADLGNYYAAGASALSINDNLYKLYFRPGREGAPAAVLRSEPDQQIRWDNFMLTGAPGSGDNGYIFRAPGQREAQLRGTVPAGPEEFAIKGSMPDPALFAAEAFTGALREKGIRVAREPRVSASPLPRQRLLARTESYPVKDIVFVTNKRSFNFYAEMLLRALAVNSGDRGSEERGLAALRKYLSGIGITPDMARLADACGLSKNNAATARALAKLLIYMRTARGAEAFAASLPCPGDRFSTGHIKTFCDGTAAQGRIRVKSGSLSGVRSYAGYIKAKSGRTIAFAFIINNYSVSGAEVDKLHERLAQACALL